MAEYAACASKSKPRAISTVAADADPDADDDDIGGISVVGTNPLTERLKIQMTTTHHVFYCFDVLYSHLHGTVHADPQFPDDK